MTNSRNGSPAPLRIGLIDMNNGVANEAIRCFKGIIAQFGKKARAANPGLKTEIAHVQPRNLAEKPPADCDLYLSSGGPGSPLDGYDEPWAADYRRFLDGLLAEGSQGSDATRALFVVCHSFELCVMHFGIARMEPRPARKFGVMPVYMTEEGLVSPLLSCFGDRLFAFEHRSWQAIGLEEGKLRAMGGELWARESRDGQSNKGEGLLGFRFCRNIEGTLFHPEADRAGALAWIARPDQAAAVVDAYGEELYLRMLRTLDDPMRLARTYALLIPGWLARRFNALALARGWQRLDPPRYDANDEATLRAFGTPPGRHRSEPPVSMPVEIPTEGV